MYQVETLADVIDRYRKAGLTVRQAEVAYRQQLLDRQRDREDAILRAAAQPGASEHIREVAEQIIDSRKAGHYTTIG